MCSETIFHWLVQIKLFLLFKQQVSFCSVNHQAYYSYICCNISIYYLTLIEKLIKKVMWYPLCRNFLWLLIRYRMSLRWNLNKKEITTWRHTFNSTIRFSGFNIIHHRSLTLYTHKNQLIFFKFKILLIAQNLLRGGIMYLHDNLAYKPKSS